MPTVLLRLAGKRDEVVEGSVEAAALAAVYAVNGDQGAFPAIQLLLLSAQDSAGRSRLPQSHPSQSSALLCSIYFKLARVQGSRHPAEAPQNSRARSHRAGQDRAVVREE